MLIGGQLAVRLLDYVSKGGTAGFPDAAPAYAGKSKMEVLFGKSVWDEFRDKDVIDFGCGKGDEAVDIAVHGARRVIGIDTKRRWLQIAAQHAAEAGVADRCTFVPEGAEPADVILSLDSFEHFADPSAILQTMHRLLRPGGVVLVSFGPTWYHPYGGHIYSVFPFSHLVFSERALVRWRSQYKTDGARSIEESGLNKMTVGRFVRLIESSPFRFQSFEPVPIRRLRPLANRLTREFTTAVVRCRLVAGV